MQAMTRPMSNPVRVVRFDARPLLAEGTEPLSQILETANALVDGEQLEVIAPFEPVPLYDVMRTRGFRVGACMLDQQTGAWSTPFTRVDITAAHTVGEVLSRHPATRASLARHGLDTCCGANLSLAQASESQGVALDTLLAELTTDAVR